ncbi:hypothetical protein GCM10010428_40980 [Actinosynnema pretiosum subsp. pretiosum]
MDRDDDRSGHRVRILSDVDSPGREPAITHFCHEHSLSVADKANHGVGRPVSDSAAMGNHRHPEAGPRSVPPAGFSGMTKGNPSSRSMLFVGA